MFRIYSRILSMTFVMSFLALQIASQSGGKQNSSAYPRPITRKPCDICTKLEDGFLKSKRRIKSLCSKAEALLDGLDDICPPPPPPPPSTIEVVVSTPTAEAANAESAARCRSGFILLTCRCTHEDATCDGVRVPGNDRFCFARNGPGGTPVRAIATCIPDDGSLEISFTNRQSSPEISCDPGKKMIDCWIENNRPDLQFSRTIINTDTGVCTTTDTCRPGGQGCKLTALCGPDV